MNEKYTKETGRKVRKKMGERRDSYQYKIYSYIFFYMADIHMCNLIKN